MATFDYTSLREEALELVQEFGLSTWVLSKLGRTPADAAKPWDGPSTAEPAPDDGRAEVTVSGVLVDPGSASRLGLLAKESDLLKRSQQILVVVPSEDTPDLSEFDRLTVGTDAWRVTGVETLRPADVVMLYYIGASR